MQISMRSHMNNSFRNVAAFGDGTHRAFWVQVLLVIYAQPLKSHLDSLSINYMKGVSSIETRSSHTVNVQRCIYKKKRNPVIDQEQEALVSHTARARRRITHSPFHSLCCSLIRRTERPKQPERERETAGRGEETERRRWRASTWARDRCCWGSRGSLCPS